MSNANAVIAGGHRLTVEAAEQVLRAGGNAFDAALAGLAASFVAEPVLSSPGGGGYLLALPVDEKPRIYDFFVQTPRQRLARDDLDFYAIHADFGQTTQEFHIGLGTVAVPGIVAGMFAVQADLASLGMRDIMSSAVEWARDGIEVTAFQAYLFDVVRATFGATEASRAIFGGSAAAGGLLTAGAKLRQPELADTLEALAFDGPELFYRGEIAATIERDMQGGGQLDRDDFARYTVERRAPLTVAHRDARVHLNPPPSSGGLLIAFGLRMFEGLDLGRIEHGSAEDVAVLGHVMEQTLEARVAARAATAEGHLSEASVLDDAFVRVYREQIAGRAASRRGTTHLSVIDARGNLASVTVSNGEGSGYIVPGTGIIMNNMLGEADLNPGGFQRWPSSHRMTSMMAPSAIEWPNGRRIALGSGGSNRIRTAVLQVILNLIDRGMAVEQAVCSPRVHFEDRLEVEGGFDAERMRRALEWYPEHHLWPERNLFFGGTHTVAWSDLVAEAVGDPRRGGVGVVI